MTDVLPLRVATWNLNHWRQPLLPVDTRRGAWDHLAGPMGASIALVQEAGQPMDVPPGRAVYGELAGYRNWGSGIIALDPAVTLEPIRSARMPWNRRRYRLDASNPGAVAVARATVPGVQPITLVSIYGVMDGSALSTIHRVVADLLPLFDSPDGARVILGGDFNVTLSSADERYLARAGALLDAIQALGLVNVKGLASEPLPGHDACPCGHAPDCGHVGTWGGSELDHLYVSPALASQVTGFAADRSGVEAGLSDHAALVADLALTDEPTPHGWDEEAFAVEIGRRHGPAARGVVESLVSWAEHKERDLAKTAGVTAKVLTRFPVTGGITATPELLLTLDMQTEPRASLVMLSIRADGTVVVWFGAWKLAPFSERSCREQVRKALNELDGIHVHWRQASGWPRIPIAVLEDRANLVKLVAVLDRVAEESHSTPAVVIEPTRTPDQAISVVEA